MKKQLQTLLLTLKAKQKEQKDAFKALDETPEDGELMTAVKARRVEIDTLKGSIKDMQELLESENELDLSIKGFADPGGQNIPPAAGGATMGDAAIKMLARSSRLGKVKNFKGPDADVRAFKLGMTALAEFWGNAKAIEFCKTHGIAIKAQTEGVNSAGGATLSPELSTDIIDLREEFGVIEKYLKVAPMKSESLEIMRRTGGLTAYWAGEGEAITASQKSWDRIELNARKLGAIALYSSELNEDSIVNLGDDLAGEIAYAFANKIDEAGFNGDGSETYGKIVGFRNALKNLSGTIANIAGLVVATGTGYGSSYDSITLKDFLKVKARLPRYAYKRGQPRWFVSQFIWNTVMESLALAAGGVPAMEIQTGLSRETPTFLGYPVEIVEVMPIDPAVSQVVALFGVPVLAGTIGMGRNLTLSLSDQYQWATDMLAIKGTQRLDINIHDVGNASGTASLRKPGPMVGLITASS